MEKVFAEWLNTKIIKTQYWEIVKVWVKVEDFKEFLDKYDNNWWVNLNLMTSKSWDKKYFELDTWKKEDKKEETKSEDIDIDSIPF